MVEVIGTWNGAMATALQAAMRMKNEEFAERLGVAVRTVAKWHAKPDFVPGTEMQQILDTAYEMAGEAVHKRFALLSRQGPARAQALRVAIAVVIRDNDVLLVCRRGDAALSWQFPAGVVKPGAAPEAVTVQEAHAETGVHCAVRQHLGSRLHPVTGVMADYYLCDHLTGDASNLDVIENAAVQWVPIREVPRFIPPDRIYSPVLHALEESA